MITIKHEEQKVLFYILTAGAVALVLFLFMQFLNTAKAYHYVGGVAGTTINVSGTGEVFAIPDIATIDFTVIEKANTISDAQSNATAREEKALAAVEALGILSTDVKTISYMANPVYETCYGYYDRVCPSSPKITGYEIRETLEVKVRDTGKAGDVIEALVAAGMTEIVGPNFTIDDDTALQAEARTNAINDAKAKADELAKELGVKIVGVVGFSESGNYPMPMYYAKGSMAMDSVANESQAPQLPAGENKITSSVTITYEIR